MLSTLLLSMQIAVVVCSWSAGQPVPPALKMTADLSTKELRDEHCPKVLNACNRGCEQWFAIRGIKQFGDDIGACAHRMAFQGFWDG